MLGDNLLVLLSTLIYLYSPYLASGQIFEAEALARRIAKVSCNDDNDCSSISNGKCEKLSSLDCQTSACVCPEGLVYVDGYQACARALSDLGGQCDEFSGCGVTHSRCYSGICRCQSGYQQKGNRCIEIGSMPANCNNEKLQITVINGTVQTSFECPTRTNIRGLRKICKDGVICENIDAICLQCNPTSPRRICARIPIDKNQNEDENTLTITDDVTAASRAPPIPRTPYSGVYTAPNREVTTARPRQSDSLTTLSPRQKRLLHRLRMQKICREIGGKIFSNNPPYRYNRYYGACDDYWNSAGSIQPIVPMLIATVIFLIGM